MEGAFKVYCDKHCCALTERPFAVLVVDGFIGELFITVVMDRTRMLRKIMFPIKNKRMMMRRRRQHDLRLRFFLSSSGW